MPDLKQVRTEPPRMGIQPHRQLTTWPDQRRNTLECPPSVRSVVEDTDTIGEVEAAVERRMKKVALDDEDVGPSLVDLTRPC